MTAERRPARRGVEALATRLIAIGALFALAVMLDVGGDAPFAERQLTALYAVVLAGFFSTLGASLIAAYGNPRRLDTLQLAVDGLLITALVYCTGGASSVFGFVFVVWIVYAALRAGSVGATVSTVGAVLAFGFVSFGAAAGWLPQLDPGGRPTTWEALTALGTHAAAFAGVAVLAHRLARQIKRGREELVQLSEIYRRIFDNVSSGLLTLDDAGRVTSFNREAERITGFASGEIVGGRLEQLLPELWAGITREYAPEERTREGTVLGRLRITFHNRKGEQLHLGLARSVLRDARGEPEGSVLIFQDLTPLVEIEDELARSERLAAVGQLATGLAHEIRNPLGSLSGAIELIERTVGERAGDDAVPEGGGAGNDGSERLFRIVQRETARLDRLVSDFLTYARPGALRSEPCSVEEIVAELAELLASSDHADVRLELDLAPGLRVAGDPDALRQVFWNLVLNAAQSGSEDGVVRVSARLESGAGRGLAGARDRVRIEFSDRGQGIPAEVRERVFEPFFTTKPKGTGLGLATVHGLVERQGGSLQLASEVGKGTTVTVILPAARDEA